jgi:hypothetical protein
MRTWILLVTFSQLGACGTRGQDGSSGGASDHPGSGGSAGTRDQGGSGSGGRVGTADSGSGGARLSRCAQDGDGKTTLEVVNQCPKPVSFTGSDVAAGTIPVDGSVCVDIGTDTEPLSAKRYWGFVGEDPGAGRHTLAEFTFNTDFNDFDWYNISHVDAYNLPMQIVPLARPKCDTLTCAQDFLAGCPEVGRYQDASGEIVACVSPRRDDGGSPVARYFEACDDAYAWSGDDQNGDDPSPVRACAGEDWAIVFCPSETP